MLSAQYPGTMPPLPAGFAEKHTAETAALTRRRDQLR